jgi:hypothetical protein
MFWQIDRRRWFPMQGVKVARPSNFADFNAQSSTTTTRFCLRIGLREERKNIVSFATNEEVNMCPDASLPRDP